MKRMEISRMICQVVASLCMALAVTSCGNGGDAGVEDCKGTDGGECPTNAVVAVEASEKLTQTERLEAECRRLVVGTKRKRCDTLQALNCLCKEIRDLPKEEALPLFDKWLDMVISQQITTTEYPLRAAWYEQLFYVVHDAFCSAQHLQNDSFERWDKLFGFFAKCTDEITSVEKTLPLTDSKFWGRKNMDKGMYLLGIRDDFTIWVHVMRDFYFPELSKGLTDEQKTDILRRFDELKKYTVQPPNFPGGKK